jgi:hypothetical protein
MEGKCDIITGAELGEQDKIWARERWLSTLILVLERACAVAVQLKVRCCR